MSNLNTITYDKTTRMAYPLNITMSYATTSSYFTTGSSLLLTKQLTISGSSLINPITVVSSNNSFSEINNQNKSNGSAASSDIVATNDIGNENIYYVDLGINSSGYTASIVGQANDAYLYNTGSHFYVGNATPSKKLYLFAGGLIDTSSVSVSSGGSLSATIVTASAGMAVGGYSLGLPITNSIQIGYQTGKKSGLNVNSIQMGYQAGQNTISASYGIQMGVFAGQNTTGDGTFVVQLGYAAGQNATTANGAVQIGFSAGRNSTVATNATQIGNAAGQNTINATDAVQIGHNCGYNCTTASYAVQIGCAAGQNATTATNAVHIGFLSGYDATNSTEVVHVGVGAGWHATNANYTTFIGAYADTLNAALNVTKSIAIGYNAKVSGNNMCVIGGTGVDAVKVGIGHNAPIYDLDVKGNFVVSVSGSVTGGGNPGDNAATLINSNAVLSYGNAQFNVGTRWNQDLVFKTNNTERARLSSSGNFGLGTPTPVYLLHVNTDSAGKPGVGGLWTVVSDKRIKTDIKLADLDRCYEIVKEVPLKYFGWKDGAYTDNQVKDRHNLGWIAQDVQKVFPKAVSTVPFYGNDGFQVKDCLDLNGGEMYMAMYGALQKAIQKIELLEKEIKKLKNK